MTVSSRQAAPGVRAILHRRRSIALPLCIAAGALAAACFTSQQMQPFVASASSLRVPSSAIQRRAGFGESDPKPSGKKAQANTVRLTQQDLEALHGEKWELVDAVFKGKKAQNPEAIMRSRFTALYYKDPQFLAATERDGEASLKRRTDNWAAALGLKEQGMLEKIGGMFAGGDIENLRDIDRFEVLDATDDQVEFKIYCKNGKTLYEKSVCKEDKKYGFIFSGDSEFSHHKNLRTEISSLQ